MRQAGRSLPEYRAIRERHALFEIVAQPELLRRGDAAAGAPARRRRGGDVRGHHDARSSAMGVDVELVEGVGPVVREPIADAPTSSGCACPTPRRRRADPRGGAASSARELDAEQAVIGFCGGPFTVAGYLVEGRPSRDFARVEGADVLASRRSGTR